MILKHILFLLILFVSTLNLYADNQKPLFSPDPWMTSQIQEELKCFQNKPISLQQMYNYFSSSKYTIRIQIQNNRIKDITDYKTKPKPDLARYNPLMHALKRLANRTHLPDLIFYVTLGSD